MYTYKTKGVCSPTINIDLDGDIIKSIEFIGGCDGNLKALASLVQGMSVSKVEEILAGNTCGIKDTSCADQLVKGLNEALKEA